MILNPWAPDDVAVLAAACTATGFLGGRLLLRWSLRALLEDAWGLIANAGGGNWTGEAEQWQVAAIRWSSRFHRLMWKGK